MKVKDRLSLQFTFMFAILLLMVLTGIYLFAERNRVQTFFDKLDDRAITVAQFYLAEDNLSKENFKSVLKKFPQSLSDETIRIYNDHYQPEFIPEGTVRWDVNILKRVLQQKQIYFVNNGRQVTGIYYADNSGNFIVMVSAVDDNGSRYMHELGLIMSFFFLLSLLATFFIGRVFSRFALHPIVNITDNLRRIRASSLDLRLPVDQRKTDEIDTLSLTINQLLTHLEQSFENQKAFIAHASHELRTPITTILGEAEITLMNDRSSDEYQQTLSNIIKETERLNNIINSLMELIETNVENREPESVRIDELLWEINDELTYKRSEVKIDLEYDLPYDPSKYTLSGNRQLLFIGISNIFKNAIKFSELTVKCKVFCDSKGINLLITDKGIGIKPADMDKIFQPFFRASNALSYPGHGIGLSLTQNIIRLHSGKIEVRSQENEGTEFHIILPHL